MVPSAHLGIGVGVQLPTFVGDDLGALGPGVAATARLAELHGADAVWVADHLFWARPCLEALTTATVAASATSTVVVGTSVVQGPLRDTPGLAKAVASAQALSAGRLVLGLGVGSHEGEYQAAGAPYADRGARFDEQLEALVRLWTPGDGRWEQRPAAEVPLWFGGSGAHVRRRVVRWGDGWTSAFLRPKALGEEVARLRDDLVAAGRDPREVTVAATVPCWVGPVDRLDRPLDQLSRMYGIDRRLFLSHLAAGTPERCVERALRFRDAGAEHLVLVVPEDDPGPHLEQLLPVLREALGAG